MTEMDRTEADAVPTAQSDPAPDYHEGLFVGDAIEFFLNVKRAAGRSQRTANEYRKKLDLFQRWAAGRVSEDSVDLPLDEIDTDTIELYLTHMRDHGLSDASRKNHLAVLRSFFDTLRKRKGIEDPVESLGEVRFHRKAPNRSYLTKREAGMLLSTVEAASREARENRKPEKVLLAVRDHAIFSVLLYAGLRIEEAADLETTDLILRRGAEEVRVAKGKGNKERRVPMGTKLKRSLRAYLDSRQLMFALPEHSRTLFLNNRGGGITENTIRRNLYNYVRKSSLKKSDIKPHDLRRTFATWYLQDNPGQFVELAELLGHSDLSQVTKYALSDAERARAGVSKL